MTRMSEIRSAAQTKRLHTWPTIGEQTIATHSWGVAMLIQHVHLQRGFTPSANLLLAALCHDLPEGHLGDMPAPIKWASENIRTSYEELEKLELSRLNVHAPILALTRDEQNLLEFCDKLELLWYCVEQRRLGNVGIDLVFQRQLRYLETKDFWQNQWFSGTAGDMLAEVGYYYRNPEKREITR